jgi:enamine deaminase RidA (YjgF/YER057c/UK114 family)
MPSTKSVLDNLGRLGLSLPQPPKPGGAYEAVNIVGNIAYVAIQMPKQPGGFNYVGRLGGELTAEDGYKAAELSALNVLAQVHTFVTFERILGLNHFDAYYQSVDGWNDAPRVIDGASHLFQKALGASGKHTRAIFGVSKLPSGYVVGLTATFTLIP